MTLRLSSSITKGHYDFAHPREESTSISIYIEDSDLKRIFLHLPAEDYDDWKDRFNVNAPDAAIDVIKYQIEHTLWSSNLKDWREMKDFIEKHYWTLRRVQLGDKMIYYEELIKALREEQSKCGVDE